MKKIVILCISVDSAKMKIMKRINEFHAIFVTIRRHFFGSTCAFHDLHHALTNEYFFFNYWRQATCVGRCKTFQFTFSYADNSKLSKVRIQKANFLKVPAFFAHEEITFDDLITRYSPWNMIRNPPLWGLDIATGWLKNRFKNACQNAWIQWGPIEIVR